MSNVRLLRFSQIQVLLCGRGEKEQIPRNCGSRCIAARGAHEA